MKQSILGIDVAKQKLDVALIFNDKTLTNQFANSTSGFKLLSKWLNSLHVTEVHACLEATGSFGDAIAHFLHTAGHLVSVVNPFRIKGYAKSKLQRNKTDIADARLIADFCLTQHPPQWFPPTPEVAELQALTRRIEVLEQMLQMERNRLATSPPKTKPSIHRMIQTFEKEIESLQKGIKNHFDRNPTLKDQQELLQSIPGIGEKTANLLLAEIEFGRYNSARVRSGLRRRNPEKEGIRNESEPHKSIKNRQWTNPQRLIFPGNCCHRA